MKKQNKKLFQVLSQWLDLEAITIVDVGARGGIHKRWERFGPYLNLVGFEPEQSECIRLNEQRWFVKTKFFPIALGSKQMKAQLYTCQSPGCSSLLEPNVNFTKDFFYGDKLDVTGVTPLTVAPLTDICCKENICPDILKIDTQGTELDILIGSIPLLDKIKLIELEVEFNPIYKNQPLFSDVDIFMRKNGYELLGLRRSHWRRKIADNLRNISSNGGQIIHGDALYFNRRLLQSIDLELVDAIKFIILFSAYKQDDFVIYFLTNLKTALATINNKDRLTLIKYLTARNHVSNTLTYIFDNNVIKHILNKVSMPITNRQWRHFLDKIRFNNVTDWHDPNFF